MIIDSLLPNDYDKGFLETLSFLRETKLTKSEFKEIYEERMNNHCHTVVAWENGKIVGTASIIIESKFLHNGGKVGHVEDVVVHGDYQRRGIGEQLMKRCEDIASMYGCYKIILDCSEQNKKFYDKLGYYQHEIEMRKDL